MSSDEKETKFFGSREFSVRFGIRGGTGFLGCFGGFSTIAFGSTCLRGRPLFLGGGCVEGAVVEEAVGDAGASGFSSATSIGWSKPESLSGSVIAGKVATISG